MNKIIKNDNKLIEALNKKNFIEDKNAKSLSFFFRKNNKNAILDKSLINLMKKVSKKLDVDLRLNLHSSPNDSYHDMIILQRKKYKCPIHKHLTTGESIKIIYGSLDIIFYNKKKIIISRVSLNTKNNIIYRIPTKLYHSIKVTSPYTIYHEGKSGPFIRKQTILL